MQSNVKIFLLVGLFAAVASISAQPMDRTFDPGWSLMSLPLIPDTNTVAALIDDNIDGAWDLVGFNMRAGWFRPDTMVCGEAYWLAIAYDPNANIEITGTENADTVGRDLDLDWNIIGNPFPRTAYLDDILFVYDGDTLTSAEAAGFNYIIPNLLGFMVDHDSSWWRDGYFERDRMAIWEGYWFRTLISGLEMVIIPPPPNPMPPRRDDSDEGFPCDWELTLVVHSETKGDVSTSLGANDNATDNWDAAYDFPEAPDNPGGEMVKAYFRFEDCREGWVNEFNHDIRSSLDDEEAEWTLFVESTDQGEITMIWPWIDQTTPRDYEFMLVDPNTDESVNLLEAEEYVFEVRDGPYELIIRVVASEYYSVSSTPQPVMFELLSAYPNPFNATTTISYNLNKASDVVLSVFDLTGRQLRILANGYHQQGNYRTVWHGENMTAGVYLIRMETSDYSTMRKVALVK